MARNPVAVWAADALARVALRMPPLELLIAAGARRPLLRRHLRLGAIACAYPRVLGRRELRIAEIDGYRFYVNVGESLGAASYFFRDSGTMWLTRSLLRPGDVCVDAGANAGYYTFQSASIVGPGGRVFAFEANPEFAELVRRSAALNGYGDIVRVEQLALYSASGEAKRFFLSVNPNNTGTSSLVNHGVFLSTDATIEVKTVSLDDFAVSSSVARFRLVKIDVERAEEDVLQGAHRLLSEGRIDYLIVEMVSRSPSQTLLERAGYRGYLLSPSDEKLVPLDVVGGVFGDFLFVRPGLEAPDDERSGQPIVPPSVERVASP